MRQRIRMSLLAALAAMVLSGTAQSQESDDGRFMLGESIGALKIGMSAAQLGRRLTGSPERGPERLWGADGLYHQAWRYRAAGIALSMVSQKRGGSQTIESIACTARCTLKTSRRIGIGSPRSVAETAYRDVVSRNDSGRDALVAGSIYGGLILTIGAGKVTRMFLGAAAE